MKFLAAICIALVGVVSGEPDAQIWTNGVGQPFYIGEVWPPRRFVHTLPGVQYTAPVSPILHALQPANYYGVPAIEDGIEENDMIVPERPRIVRVTDGEGVTHVTRFVTTVDQDGLTHIVENGVQQNAPCTSSPCSPPSGPSTIERVIEGRRAPQRWTANGITMEVTEMVAGSHFKLNCYAAHGNNEGNYWESPDSQWIGQSKNSYFKKRGSTQFIDWGAIKGSYPGRRVTVKCINKTNGWKEVSGTIVEPRN